MKYFNIIKKRWKLLFCYLLFLISILFSLIIVVVKPMKVSTYFPYEYSEKNVSDIEFPVIQHFKKTSDYMKTININFSNEAINHYDYSIRIYGNESKKEYFSNLYHHYGSSIVILDASSLNSTMEDEFVIQIDCEKCRNVGVSLKHSNDKKMNYIEERDDDKIIEMNYSIMVPNNSYYWYSIFGVLVSLILYLFAKGEIDDEK